MDIIQEIAGWARTLPPWQSDAVRRIFTQDRLSSADEAEILALLYGAHGLSEPGATVPIPSPFADIVSSEPPTACKVLLKEIHSLENVNALVQGQSLKFALDGLTVVYGENAAGKSGYARVFKHACHAREKGDPILTNVSKPSKSKPAATVELLVDDEHTAIRWTSGAPASHLLSRIAVFDSHCVRFHRRGERGLLPPIRRGRILSPKRAVHNAKGPGCDRLVYDPRSIWWHNDYSETTAAGRFVRSLSDNSDEEEVEALSFLDEKTALRLADLRVVVASAKANPPKQEAAQRRRAKKRFEQLRTAVATIAAAFSPDTLSRIAKSQIAATAALEAARLASKEAFSSDPLASTGSEPWRILFDAARSYSETTAYPGESFPVVRSGAVCLLCQQTLADPAVQRLTRFEKFVKDEAARRSDEAQAELRDAAKAITDLKLNAVDHDPTLSEELRALDPDLAETVDGFFTLAKSAHTAATGALRDGTIISACAPLVSPIPALNDAITALETQAQRYDAADKPEELKKLTDELAELEDRKRLKSHADSVRAFIKEKKRGVALRKCEHALDTSAVTRRGSELMQRAVTEQLIANVKDELLRLGLRRLPVQVKKLGEKGKTKHQLVVPNSSKPSLILSEGEQRVVAIACFLAELKTAGSRAPIIFDDPVSSLDHLYRERLASRLVEEGKTRQVVIFTHDVVMLLALEREAAKQQGRFLIHTVRRSVAGPGECIHTEPRPWYACNVKERISQLKNDIAPFKKLAVESSDGYRTRVAEFYGKLRETWERAIEELLFQDVIQRFRPSVETQRLRSVSIEGTDYVAIHNGMSKCSAWLEGHDSAAAVGATPPSPDEVAADLKEFEEFCGVLRKRADNTGKGVRALLEPPAPTVSGQRAATVIDLATSTRA